MAENVNNFVAALIYNRVEVRQTHLETALRHLRAAVPALEVVDEDTPTPSLRWSRQPVHASAPLGGVLWEFMELTEATDEQIIEFARRFGPLVWREAKPGEQGLGSAATASQEQSFTEPLQIWRGAARGVRALFDLVDPALPRGALSSDTWTWSIAPIAVPVRLANPDSAAPALEEELTALAMAGPPGLGPDPNYEDVSWPDRLLTAALAAAGVDPAYQSDPSSGLCYAIPGRLTSRANETRALPWQVEGLQPILMVSVALAAQTQERPRCTWCGNPAAIALRGPRKGRPWYGNHVMCRALARAKTMNQAEDKRTEKRRARTAHPGSSREP
jgi:hypothetical protein